MEELFIILFELSINLFESYILIDFITKFNGEKYSDKKHILLYITGIILLFVDVTLANFKNIHIEIPSYVAIIIMIIYSAVALKGKLVPKIASCILINVILILVSGIFLLIFGMIYNVSLYVLMNTFGAYRFVLLISSKVFLFYTSRIILNYKHIRYKKIPKSSWLLITVIPLLTIFIMVIITESAANNSDTRINLYLLLSIFGLIISNVVFYHTFMLSVKESEMSVENRLLKLNFELEKKYSFEIKELYKQIQTMRHDMKNQLISMQALIEDEKYDKAMDYMNSMIEKIEVTKKFVFTKNDMFNAIINSKFSEANSKNIKTTVNICCDIDNQMEDSDINILFGNLLDNAIESCEKSEGHKEINLLIEKKKNYLSIQVANSIYQPVLQNNPELHTSKTDKENHGMGIKSIKKIVQKYDGIMDFIEKEGLFICNILILPEKSKYAYQVSL